MSKITHIASRAAHFCRGRVGARLLLILGCCVCLSLFSGQIEKVNIYADGASQTYYTMKDTPQEIVSQYGLALGDADSVRVVGDESENTGIEVLRAFDVTVTDAGVPHVVEISSGSVTDAIALAGVELPDGDDEISVALDEQVYAYMDIVIDRVHYEETAKYETVAYKTVKHETAGLYKGQTRVATQGRDGEKRVTIRKKWVNGALVEETVVSETIVTEAVNEVIDVGTASAATTSTTAASGSLSTKPTGSSSGVGGTFVDASGRTVSYSKVMTGTGTAYTAPVGSKTSTGREVEVGIVAVDPDVIPYGTRLYIVSSDGKHVYGYALAADTGSALRNGSALVDLFYKTESQCLAFGRREVIVYVLG